MTILASLTRSNQPVMNLRRLEGDWLSDFTNRPYRDQHMLQYMKNRIRFLVLLYVSPGNNWLKTKQAKEARHERGAIFDYWIILTPR